MLSQVACFNFIFSIIQLEASEFLTPMFACQYQLFNLHRKIARKWPENLEEIFVCLILTLKQDF